MGDSGFIYFIFWSIVMLLTGFCIGISAFKTNAVDKGYAIYCPLDGEWAWKPECQKDFSND